ncbi:Autoinducer 2 sensor kinase/phosphatase LuxQ [Dirofilaria immitis]
MHDFVDQKIWILVMRTSFPSITLTLLWHTPVEECTDDLKTSADREILTPKLDRNLLVPLRRERLFRIVLVDNQMFADYKSLRILQ